MKKLPPRLFLRFFQWYCNPKLRYHIEGDLIEEYNERLVLEGKAKANLKFVIDVILLCRPTIIRSFRINYSSNSTAMLKSYLLIGWRNLWKEKGYSLINIGGLAMGIAFSMVIALWIINEINYDSFHINGDNIALIKKNTFFNNQKSTQDYTPYPLADELKSHYPEVKRASRMTSGIDLRLDANEKALTRNCRFVEPDFLQMFSFEMLAGDAKTALNDPLSVVLTESVAHALFGDNNPLGKTVKLANREDLIVTGVVKDVPSNSTLTFDFLCSYERIVANDPFVRANKNGWGNNFLMTVVELKAGESMTDFTNTIRNLNMEKDSSLKDQTLALHPLKKWHLYNEFENWENVGGKIEYVRLFAVIGIFVLLIASINFMNLSTARSQKRAKEIGIRKTMGSARRQLIIQFLSESVLTVFIAFILALCLISIGVQYLTDLGIDGIHLDNISLLVVGLFTCVGVGLLAGSYPAFYLSSFSPIRVLKGLFKQGNTSAHFRRVLVVLQFTVSIALIISTVIVLQQIQYAKTRSVGYDPNNMISIPSTDDLRKNFQTMKNELIETGNIEAVASASSPMTAVYNKWSDFSWEGKDPNAQIALEVLLTEWDLDRVAGLKFEQGRPFSMEHASDSNGIILNASAAKVIGYTDPIGKKMRSGDREVTIVGVIEDLVMLDPFGTVSPGVILFSPQIGNTILVRLKSEVNLSDGLAGMETILKKYNAGQVVDYSFVDQDFDRKFLLEKQVARLSGAFALLAIVISALGLIGLASFMAEQRLKEIGIRKILGASVSGLWGMLSKEFVVLILFSCVNASLIAWYIMNDWLMNFEYRMEISFWVFVATSAVALIITVITVSFQSLKVALLNPVKTLRSE